MPLATQHVRSVPFAVAAAVVLILTTLAQLELRVDMSSIYDAGQVTFTRFLCCNCYDRCPNWIDGTFGTRRAAELHISRSAMCRAAGKGVRAITSEYRQSNRVED